MFFFLHLVAILQFKLLDSALAFGVNEYILVINRSLEQDMCLKLLQVVSRL